MPIDCRRYDPYQQENPEYFNFRTDPADPDFKNIIEYMVDKHPNPMKSKKALCAEVRIEIDSFRKYMGNPFGPPLGLMVRFMKLTGCYKLLYWMCKNCGFIPVPEPETRWDKRKKLKTESELDISWVELRKCLIDMNVRPGDKIASKNDKLRRKAQKLVRQLQEQLVGLELALDNLNPQIDLFDTAAEEED